MKEEILKNSEEIIEVSAESIMKVETEPEELVSLKKDIKDDFQYARNNIKNVINTGMEAMDNLSRIASESEHPRIFECLSTLLQINSVNNTLLLDLDNKFKNMIEGKSSENSEDSTGNVTQNNVLFVGTTTDIQKIIEDKLKGR